jgi:hypothetical protein
MKNQLRSFTALAVVVLPLCLAVAGRANAATLHVVTPGEQNTKSGENSCNPGCDANHWYHYPELIQMALGAGYVVQNNGDGGAVLGCDPTTVDIAGGNSFCKSGTYTASLTPTPDIVIIGPFGEHDQRIVAASAANVTSYYKQSVFEAAYEGLVAKYLKGATKVYLMTPLDLPFGSGPAPALPTGDNLAKNIMLPAVLKVAANHNLTVIDSYTALTGTPALITQYYGTDGQVNSAGQQKMAMLIEAALAMPGSSGTGGSTGTTDGGATGAGGAKADGGSDATGAGGSTGAAGTTASTTGAAGATASTTGAAGTTASTTGAAGTTASTTGAAGTTASTTGAAGTTSSAGTSGASTGAAGSGTIRSPGGGGGCAYATPARGGLLGLAMATALFALTLSRRRRR